MEYLKYLGATELTLVIVLAMASLFRILWLCRQDEEDVGGGVQCLSGHPDRLEGNEPLSEAPTNDNLETYFPNWAYAPPTSFSTDSSSYGSRQDTTHISETPPLFKAAPGIGPHHPVINQSPGSSPLYTFNKYPDPTQQQQQQDQQDQQGQQQAKTSTRRLWSYTQSNRGFH